MEVPKWFTELQSLKWRPGTVDVCIDLINSIQTESIKIKVIDDTEGEIKSWIPRFEEMSEKLKNDKIAAPTKDEKAFYKWAVNTFQKG